MLFSVVHVSNILVINYYVTDSTCQVALFISCHWFYVHLMFDIVGLACLFTVFSVNYIFICSKLNNNKADPERNI